MLKLEDGESFQTGTTIYVIGGPAFIQNRGKLNLRSGWRRVTLTETTPGAKSVTTTMKVSTLLELKRKAANSDEKKRDTRQLTSLESAERHYGFTRVQTLLRRPALIAHRFGNANVLPGIR